MRTRVLMISIAALVATPAQAVGLEDLAKVVLGGQSVLKKADETCPNSKFALTKSDQLALTFARAAVEQALPISQVVAIDQVSAADAANDAKNPTFCNETKKKKSGLMSKIKKAGRALAKARLGL